MVSVTLWMRCCNRSNFSGSVSLIAEAISSATPVPEPRCVVHTDDVVLKVSDLVIHEVDKGDGLCVAEGFAAPSSRRRPSFRRTSRAACPGFPAY